MPRNFLRNFQRCALLALVSAVAFACDDAGPEPLAETQPSALALGTQTQPEIPPPAQAEVLPESTAALSETASPPPEAPPWQGPFFVVLETSAGIYEEMSSHRRSKIGYAEEGARIGVYPEPEKRENCREGWFQVVGGGYICGKSGTVNLDDPRVKNAPRQPNIEAVLPFRYARNGRNGTPMYRSVPSPEQIRTYEPDRFKTETKSDKGAPPAPSQASVEPAVQKAREDQLRRINALRDARRAMLGVEAAKKLEAAEALERTNPAPAAGDAGAPTKEWWQNESVELHKIKLDDLNAGGDEVLAKRMVKGFYVAIERQFEWNSRLWYRSTKGGIAPADRFYEVAGSEFHGVVLDASWKLPIGWVFGATKNRTKYEIDLATQRTKPAGSVDRFTAVNLTTEEVEIGKTTYVQAAEGFWMRKRDLRIASVGALPADLAPNERWIDVNLSTQTVLLFEGTQPIYATLMSSGKESTIKEKDHRTPTGEWRIREKHVTATMDGDGSAAGDLPYSIEGVPYVMYFHNSYALHGAFWHQNYGVRMSHGCINLAPLDAKYLFFHTDPPVPPGWSGSWNATNRPGSRVVVHE
jgi:L,D-transpeptidase catalytic domain